VVAVVLAALLQGPTKPSTKPVIVSGISQWGALARQLAGPDATVVALLSDPNADPHDHEATVSDAENVANASIIVVNGAGYDTWLSQLVSARSSKVTTIDMARIMGVANGQNPHIFYNPLAAIRFVKTLTATLDARPGYAGVAGRSSTLLAQLDAIQRQMMLIRRSCAGAHVAATEDVTTYLLSDAGLDIVTPESLRLAIGNSVDPSVQELATALNQLKQHPAFLIDNIQTATPLTNEMVAQADASHVPVIKVTETMVGTSYPKWMGQVIAKIKTDLRKQGCLK
jgi:zinc/manganese transport system substrate-binding protein